MAVYIYIAEIKLFVFVCFNLINYDLIVHIAIFIHLHLTPSGGTEESQAASSIKSRHLTLQFLQCQQKKHSGQPTKESPEAFN